MQHMFQPHNKQQENNKLIAFCLDIKKTLTNKYSFVNINYHISVESNTASCIYTLPFEAQNISLLMNLNGTE